MMNDRLYQVLKKGAVILAVGCAYCVWLALTGIGIPCVFHLVTGLKCPGCGVSRACICEAQLNFASAAHYNIAFVILQPVWAVCIIMWLFDSGVRFRRVVSIISLIILLLFFVLRNIPFIPIY